MSRPLDRNADLPALGAIDHAAGEFWVSNPFQMPTLGKNLSAYERNALFLNLGAAKFLNASYFSGADIDSDSRSVVAADFDGDRAPDLLVASVGGGPLRLFRNAYPQRRRLRVWLEGARSNRAGIGARLIAEIDNRRLVRDLFPANGFMGIGPAHVEFGLDEAECVDRLTIRWPSGQVQQIASVPATDLVIREGRPGFVRLRSAITARE